MITILIRIEYNFQVFFSICDNLTAWHLDNYSVSNFLPTSLSLNILVAYNSFFTVSETGKILKNSS